jgi:type I restriction enzyme S subunit
MMYQKYDAYKDSGVQWLGEIPKDWEVVRFKDICTFSKD